MNPDHKEFQDGKSSASVNKGCAFGHNEHGRPSGSAHLIYRRWIGHVTPAGGVEGWAVGQKCEDTEDTLKGKSKSAKCQLIHKQQLCGRVLDVCPGFFNRGLHVGYGT
jgi:hypothetical protein